MKTKKGITDTGQIMILIFIIISGIVYFNYDSISQKLNISQPSYQQITYNQTITCALNPEISISTNVFKATTSTANLMHSVYINGKYIKQVADGEKFTANPNTDKLTVLLATNLTSPKTSIYAYGIAKENVPFGCGPLVISDIVYKNMTPIIRLYNSNETKLISSSSLQPFPTNRDIQVRVDISSSPASAFSPKGNMVLGVWTDTNVSQVKMSDGWGNSICPSSKVSGQPATLMTKQTCFEYVNGGIIDGQITPEALIILSSGTNKPTNNLNVTLYDKDVVIDPMNKDSYKIAMEDYYGNDAGFQNPTSIIYIDSAN